MQLVVAAAGSYIGSTMITGTVLGMTGAQLGFMAGSMLANVLFPPKMPDGPRMNDLTVQISSYGAAIPRVWGAARIAGNVIWTTDLVEHAHEEGGKGGPSYTTYTYTVSFAVSLCEGPIAGVRRIWADGKLIYDKRAANLGESEGFTASGYVLYLGTEDQDVDPTIQAYMTNTPAYRGQAYCVFTDLELTRYGNRIPNLSFEVVTVGDATIPPARAIGSGDWVGAFDPVTGHLWTVHRITNVGADVYVTDVVTETTLATIAVRGEPYLNGHDMTYNPTTGEFWLAKDAPGLLGADAAVLNAAAMSFTRFAEFTSGAFPWTGAILYNSVTDKLWVGTTNGAASGIFILSNTGVYENLIDLNGWIVKMYELSGTGLIAVQKYGSSIYLINASTSTIESTFTTDFGSSSGSYLAYDPVRRQIYAGDYSPWDHCFIIDLDARTMTSVPFGAALELDMVIYHSGRGQFIGVDNQMAFSPKFTFFNPVDFRYTQFQTVGADNTRVDFFFEVTGHNNYVVGTCADNILRKFFFDGGIEPEGIPLSQIVTDLSLSCGLTVNDIDVTELTDLVWGFPIARQGAGRSAIEYLMMAFLFDAVESEGKVKFVKRGAAPVLTIAADDLAVHEQGQDVPASLELTRADEIELPCNVNLKYINFEADYQTSAQNATRQCGRALGELTMDMPVVMMDTQAKAVADYALFSAWAARTTAKWATSLKFAKAEPTDVVRVADNLLRITKRSLQGNILSFEGAMESGIVVASAALAGEAYSVAQTIVVYGPTALMLLDVPMLRDEDDDAGFYMAASGYADGWPGCVLLKSVDNGASYAQMQSLVTPTVIGTSSGVLGDFGGNVFDEINTVNVILYSGELASSTELAVLNGGNAAVLGNEIIQFKNANLVSGTTYTLSGLLRGRKGSPTGGHVSGERFVLLNPATLRRTASHAAEIGLARIYRSITIGATFSSGTDIAFTNTAQSLECLSPVQLGGGRDASGNLTLTWVRRTRVGGEWRDLVDASLGEVSENYGIDICSDGTFASVVRTLTSTTPTVNYSAFDQVTDFGSAQAVVYAVVYQISASMSRGAPLQGVI